jgi:hypothetical protein
MECNHYIEYSRGRVSKQVTNGSKTAVMDVIGFLCVSLGNSTVQLHDSLGSRHACACSEVTFGSQNGDRASGVYYQRATFSCAFFWGQKDSLQMIFIKKFFLFTVGSAFRGKRLKTGYRNSLKDVRKSQMRPDHVALLRLQQKQLCSGWKS